MRLEHLEPQHKEPFLELIADFAAHDPSGLALLLDGREVHDKTFHKFASDCAKDRLDWRPGPGKVSVSHYVLTDQGTLRGYGRLRFPLSDNPRVGNLEFFVPPAQRGQGYGALTLNRLLFEAVRAGLARALVVCRAGDHAAIRCVEKNRGVPAPDPQSPEYLRYWIPFR